VGCPRCGGLDPAFRGFSTTLKPAYLASFDEIRDNDFNLNIPRYVDTFEEEEEIDLMAVRREREKLKAQLSELETEMGKYLQELGYGA
jgi:type I restriction enzyme M protein